MDRIDFWFPEPAVRQSYLQPAWVGGGDKEGPPEVDPERRIAYVNLFYQVPVLEHQANPVIFPKDGQEDVPTSFEALWDATATFGMGQLGYPITVTVGSQGDPNIQVRSSTLSGPDGNVELFVEQLEPGHSLVTIVVDLRNQRAEHAAGWFFAFFPAITALTAVVGVATTAVALALVVRIREAYETIEEDEIQEMDAA